jgi:hypothetical protein
MITVCSCLRICSQFYSEVSERELRQSLPPSGNGVTFANEVIAVAKGFDDGSYHAE